MTTIPTPAASHLRALAAATRPDWHPDDVHKALAAAHFAGMAWPRVLEVMGRLMADPDARPADLILQSPKPWRTPPPGDYARGAALARAACHRPTHDITDTASEGGRPT